MNEYIFIESNGNVKSTLKTFGTFEETLTCIKVENSDQFAGKRYLNGEPVERIVE